MPSIGFDVACGMLYGEQHACSFLSTTRGTKSKEQRSVTDYHWRKAGVTGRVSLMRYVVGGRYASPSSRASDGDGERLTPPVAREGDSARHVFGRGAPTVMSANDVSLEGLDSASVVAMLNRAQIAERTRDFAAQIRAAVLDVYLEFRRKYYQESDPSLEVPPPQSNAVQRNERAVIAHEMLRALQLLPREIQAIVLIRDLLDQLQWETDIHTLTENERSTLHNIAHVFLHGVDGGVQPWYVDWLLQSAQNLQHATDERYYLAFPWQGLLYRRPEELRAFAAAVRSGDVAGIEHEIERMANGLVEVLRDPMNTQSKLAFSGPDGERRHLLFRLKTSAGLALGAYLAVEQINSLLHPRKQTSISSALPPLPESLMEHLKLAPEGTAVQPGS